jgi:hypothetical protein
MLSNPTHIIKNAILLMVLLCLLAFSTACSAPASDESSENGAPEIVAADPERPAHTKANDAAVSETQSDEDTLVSSVFESNSAKTEYVLGEAFDESGLSLTLQYSSGKTDTITSGFSSDLDTTSPGAKEIHIQYQGALVGTLRVTVVRSMILDSCDAGSGYDDDVQLISYGGKLYGIGMEYPDATHCEFFIYRKDTLDAAPVRLFRSQHISDFLVLGDRIFFSTITDDYQTFIASIDLNGGDYYELTSPEQNCKWCYYSNGWIYSYARKAKQIVRFRTNGSAFSPVVADKSRYNPAYYIANGRIISQSALDMEETITCYDTVTGASSVIVQTELNQTRLEGVYGDLLFYSIFDSSLQKSQNGGGWKFVLYDLKTGSSTTLASGPHDCTYHALVMNGSIVVYTWSGDVSFRDSSAPSICTKGFTLPVEMSGCDTSGCRMVCAGDLLAFSDGQGHIYLVDESNAAQAVLGNDGFNDSNLVSQAVSDTDWTQVYGRFLSAHAESLSYIDFMDHYALYDIIGDGIPELFLAQQLGSGSPFYNYFIYTVDGASAVQLGQVPGSSFSLCPVDSSGFLSVMQRMFCETVILYTYENGALHEQTLLYEIPVEQLPKDAFTPLDEMGYHIFTWFRTYSVDDLSNLSESSISSGSNQVLVSLLQSETNNS